MGRPCKMIVKKEKRNYIGFDGKRHDYFYTEEITFLEFIKNLWKKLIY